MYVSQNYVRFSQVFHLILFSDYLLLFLSSLSLFLSLPFSLFFLSLPVSPSIRKLLLFSIPGMKFNFLFRDLIEYIYSLSRKKKKKNGCFLTPDGKSFLSSFGRTFFHLLGGGRERETLNCRKRQTIFQAHRR